MSKPINKIIDSRHLKILAAKKEDLKDSVVFVCLDEDRYGEYDIAGLRKLSEALDQIEPSACYFVSLKNQNIQIHDMSEFKNKSLLVTLNFADRNVDTDVIEDQFRAALSCAKDIAFVHADADITKR